MAVNWALERQKLNATYVRAETALNAMKRSAKKAGVLSAEAQAAAQSVDTMKKARALPLAAQAYNSRINAEASRYEAAYFLMANDLRERGLETASAASTVKDAQRRQPLVTSATTNVRAADLMEQAAIAAGKAARDKAPPLDPEFGGRPERAGGEMQTGNAHNWRPRAINDLMNPFYPPDIRNAAGALGALGQLGAVSWWEGVKKALGVGVAAAGSAASKEGQKVAADDPAAGAAVTAGGGTLQWLSTLLGAEYNATATKPPPSQFPWAPILIGTGIAGVLGIVIWKSTK